ncbi:MAG: DUF402 domain-containing protein [Chloroflexota bacterium]|nr:DUF402 domain-containing protein [Chloroflexota bacterium]
MPVIPHINSSADINEQPVNATPSREIWDLYDIHGQPQGRTIVRGDHLNDGEYHLVVQVWVKNSRGEYLIQKRADNGIWATTAGCVVAGETSGSGAIRELAEELGIRAAPHELRQMYQDTSQYALGTAWLLERDVADADMCIQAEEVTETMWANQALIRRMVDHGLFYDYGDAYFQHVFETQTITGTESDGTATYNNLLQAGDIVTIQSFRADGTCYRSWQATIEQRNADQIITMTPAKTHVEGIGGGWVQQYHIRAFYWLDRPYNLLEVYRGDGTLEEVYIHIASPVRLQQGIIAYTDHELDVVMRPGEAPRVVDEDEFTQAVVTYKYSTEFQKACQDAVKEAVQLAANWHIRGLTLPSEG